MFGWMHLRLMQCSSQTTNSVVIESPNHQIMTMFVVCLLCLSRITSLKAVDYYCRQTMNCPYSRMLNLRWPLRKDQFQCLCWYLNHQINSMLMMRLMMNQINSMTFESMNRMHLLYSLQMDLSYSIVSFRRDLFGRRCFHRHYRQRYHPHSLMTLLMSPSKMGYCWSLVYSTLSMVIDCYISWPPVLSYRRLDLLADLAYDWHRWPFVWIAVSGIFAILLVDYIFLWKYHKIWRKEKLNLPQLEHSHCFWLHNLYNR